MPKTMSIRCNMCKQIVGSAKVVDSTDVETVLDAEMRLDQHLPDCPILKTLEDNSLKGLSINMNVFDDPSSGIPMEKKRM